MDSEWHPVFLFSGENDQRNLFYQNPIRAAQSYPEAEPKELGYWSKPFYLDERSVPVITYSMPLRAPDGTVYGVLGVEITLDYLASCCPIRSSQKRPTCPTCWRSASRILTNMFLLCLPARCIPICIPAATASHRRRAGQGELLLPGG